MNQDIPNRPTVYLLATGGTIAGRADSPLSTGDYRAGELSVSELLAAVPGLGDLALIEGEQVANVASPSITTDIWLTLARRANELLARSDVQGIVITHGTDSLEETAYFLHLVIKSEKPVVLTGSMRPATALSPDGPLNLVNAVHTALAPSSNGQGVLVVMNDQIFSARDVTKAHVSHLHTFRSGDLGPLGSVDNGVVSYYHRQVRRHTVDTEFDCGPLPRLPKVDIIYAHLGADGAFIETAVARGARGLVFAGMGQGGGTDEQSEALIKAREAGVIVVRASRTGGGRVLPQSKERLQRGATITADNLNPQKARILLALALTVTADPEKIQRMFGVY